MLNQIGNLFAIKITGFQWAHIQSWSCAPFFFTFIFSSRVNTMCGRIACVWDFFSIILCNYLLSLSHVFICFHYLPSLSFVIIFCHYLLSLSSVNIIRLYHSSLLSVFLFRLFIPSLSFLFISWLYLSSSPSVIMFISDLTNLSLHSVIIRTTVISSLGLSSPRWDYWLGYRLG